METVDFILFDDFTDAMIRFVFASVLLSVLGCVSPSHSELTDVDDPYRAEVSPPAAEVLVKGLSDRRWISSNDFEECEVILFAQTVGRSRIVCHPLSSGKVQFAIQTAKFRKYQAKSRRDFFELSASGDARKLFRVLESYSKKRDKLYVSWIDNCRGGKTECMESFGINLSPNEDANANLACIKKINSKSEHNYRCLFSGP